MALVLLWTSSDVSAPNRNCMCLNLCSFWGWEHITQPVHLGICLIYKWVTDSFAQISSCLIGHSPWHQHEMWDECSPPFVNIRLHEFLHFIFFNIIVYFLLFQCYLQIFYLLYFCFIIYTVCTCVWGHTFIINLFIDLYIYFHLFISMYRSFIFDQIIYKYTVLLKWSLSYKKSYLSMIVELWNESFANMDGKEHIKSGHKVVFVRSHSRFTKRHPESAFVLLLWRCIRISGGEDQTLCPFCSSLFALRVLKAALVFEEPQDLCLDCHWHVFPHKCNIGCERFSLSRFWRCTRIDVLSRTSGLPNSPRVSPISP